MAISRMPCTLRYARCLFLLRCKHSLLPLLCRPSPESYTSTLPPRAFLVFKTTGNTPSCVPEQKYAPFFLACLGSPPNFATRIFRLVDLAGNLHLPLPTLQDDL